MNADEIRSKLVENFNAAKPTLDAYYEYAKTAGALAEEYHNARLTETFTGVKIQEAVLVMTCDARETPASLDKKLIQLKDNGIIVKHILFDRPKSTYYLFL